MTVRYALPPADLLGQAIDYIKPTLADRSIPLGARLRDLWAAVVAARDFAAGDVVQAEFETLAIETGLAAELGGRARDDVAHVIRWALLDQNPFQ